MYELGKLYKLSVRWFPHLLVGITTESISELLRTKYVKICKALTVPGRMSYYVALYIAILFNYFLAHLIKVETMELKDLPRTTQRISNRAGIRTQLYLTPEPTYYTMFVYSCFYKFVYKAAFKFPFLLLLQQTKMLNTASTTVVLHYYAGLTEFQRISKEKLAFCFTFDIIFTKS